MNMNHINNNSENIELDHERYGNTDIEAGGG